MLALVWMMSLPGKIFPEILCRILFSSSPEEEKKEKHIDFVYKPAFVELDNEIPR